MNERQIDPSEVRVGDRVRVSYEADVYAIGDGGIPRLERMSNKTYTLLNRPLPPIPTDDGTVIQHRDDPVATVVRINGRWRSQGGTHPPAWTPGPAEWRVLVPGDQPTPAPAPAPKAQRKVIALIDRDGDRWNADGDEWKYNEYLSSARTRLEKEYGPLTEVYGYDK